MDNNKESFAIRNGQQINRHLAKLHSNGCILSVHFDHKKSFLTAILGIDPQQNTLHFDYGPAESLNQNLLSSESVEFKTNFNGIAVEFSGKNITRRKLNNTPVFSMPPPISLIWMQRRVFYRLKIPMFHESYLELSISNPINKQKVLYQFELIDISLSGFAFINSDRMLSKTFSSMQSLLSCQIVLNGIVFEKITLFIRNKAALTENNKQRIGCSIEDISYRNESVIQRYMQNIEREQRKAINA